MHKVWQPIGWFVLGAAVSWVALCFLPKRAISSNGVPLRDLDSGYTFIKPLLACDVGAITPSTSLTGLRQTLADMIAREQALGTVETASVFVRSLDQGIWTGVHEEEQYLPASLSKVPVLMAYLKRAQAYPNLLTATVTVTPAMISGAVQDIPPQEQAEVGETYTIEELLRLMIVHSDNRALAILFQSVDVAVLDEMMADLGIPAPEDLAAFRMSPRLYSRFLRILYSATFLSEEMSDRALTMMNDVAYDRGLRAAVPDEIAVAHKFGEASVQLENGAVGHELHECGIIYTADPYLLCVMTRGREVEDLEQLIRTIGAETHQFFSTVKN